MYEAIILAGGLGTRLQKVVNDVPKPMADIDGKPFLRILLDNLAKQKFSRVVISVGYKKEHIINYFGDKYNGIAIKYCTEDSPLGTGGAIKHSAKQCLNNEVFILNGDTFIEFNAKNVAAKYQEMHLPIMIVKYVKNNSRYGKVEVINNKVQKFINSQICDNNLINAGLYYFPKQYLLNIDTSFSNSFEKSCLLDLSQQKKIYAYVETGFFIDIGVPQDYEKAKLFLNK